MSKELPKAPCIGENVVWFPHGDTNQEPFAATVTARMNDKCITLYTLSPTGRREPMLNVKHVNHPDHESSPQGLKRWGAWDFLNFVARNCRTKVAHHGQLKVSNSDLFFARKPDF